MNFKKYLFELFACERVRKYPDDQVTSGHIFHKVQSLKINNIVCIIPNILQSFKYISYNKNP